MKRFVSLVLSPAVISLCLVLAGCKGQPETKKPEAAAPAATTQSSATPQSDAVNKAISEAMSKPGVPAPGQTKPGATPAAAKLPPSIPESVKRPLTVEEICNLPPDARDMILKAQGRPDACAKLKKK